MRIKAWLQKRQIAKAECRQHPKDVQDLFTLLSNIYGAEFCGNLSTRILALAEPLALQYAKRLSKSEDSIEVIKTLHRAATDQATKDRIKTLAPSKLISAQLEKSIQQSWANITKQVPTYLDLSKKVDKDTWNSFSQSHSPQAQTLVNHDYHVSSSKVPQAYKDMLADPKEHQQPVKPIGGISEKMFHDVKSFHKDGEAGYNTLSGHVMAKPYHKQPEEGTEGYCPHPIFGWSTITTNRIYHAAGLPHLTDAVHAHVHQDVPMTVHEFAPNMTDISDAEGKSRFRDNEKYKINGNDLAKIGLMDFLTGNLDRHAGNLLTDSKANSLNPETGFNRLLAIDHERNFQYAQPLDYVRSSSRTGASESDSPYDYIETGGLRIASDLATEPDFRHVSDWWKKASLPVRQEFEKHLPSITDPELREHIRNNFNDRAEWLDKWTKSVDSIPKYTLDHLEREGGVIPRRFRVPSEEDIGKIAAALPADPKEAFSQVHDWARERKDKLLHKDLGAIHDVLSQRVAALKPDQIVDMFMHAVSNPKYHSHDMSHLDKQISPREIIMENLRHSRDPKIIDPLIKKLESHYAKTNDFTAWAAIANLKVLELTDPNKITELIASEESW